MTMIIIIWSISNNILRTQYKDSLKEAPITLGSFNLRYYLSVTRDMDSTIIVEIFNTQKKPARSGTVILICSLSYLRGWESKDPLGAGVQGKTGQHSATSSQKRKKLCS